MKETTTYGTLKKVPKSLTNLIIHCFTQYCDKHDIEVTMVVQRGIFRNRILIKMVGEPEKVRQAEKELTHISSLV